MRGGAQQWPQRLQCCTCSSGVSDWRTPLEDSFLNAIVAPPPAVLGQANYSYSADDALYAVRADACPLRPPPPREAQSPR
jgi:hypothetical protein